MTSSALLTQVVAVWGSVWKGWPSTRMDTFFTPGNWLAVKRIACTA